MDQQDSKERDDLGPLCEICPLWGLIRDCQLVTVLFFFWEPAALGTEHVACSGGEVFLLGFLLVFDNLKLDIVRSVS